MSYKANTATGAFLTNHGVIVGAGDDELSALPAATNGQLIIGSAGADPSVAALTGSTGITVTNGAGTITLSTDDAAINHDALTNFNVNEHFTQANITTVGIVATGTWQADVIDHVRGGLEADVSAYDGYIRIASGATTNIKCEFAGTTAPTVNDDSSSGYTVGSRWVDTTNNKEYVCLDATAAAAVWTETTQSGSNPALNDVTDVTISAPADNEVLAYNGAGAWINQTAAEAGLAASSHAHAASDINSGALTHERGGLEADVSLYSGLVFIDAGSTSAKTIGIANTNILQVDQVGVAGNDYAKFTANGIEGRSYAEVKTDLSLNAVENTAISTWGGSANIASLGTVSTGTWNASVISVPYGGTGASSLTDHGVLVGSGTAAITALAVGSNNQYLVGLTGLDPAFAALDISDDPSPQLGGDLDLNQKSIVLDPTPAANLTWNGEVATFTAGEALVIGDVCYLKSDGKFWKADADAEATTKGVLALATATIAADATGTFLLRGFIRDDTWAWTVGAELYVSLTPGNPTATKPSLTGDLVRIVGYAYSVAVIYFNPDNTYVEIA